MKNASFILNIILLIAVAFLFIDRYTGDGGPVAPSGEKAESSAEEAPPIVFVNADSLLEKYDYFREQQDILSQREQQADANLKARGRTIEKEARELSKKAQSGTMTPRQLQEEESRLMAKQQRLMQDQERISQDLLAAGNELNNELQRQLKSSLQALRDSMGYSYIVSYGSGSPILMANDSLNITTEVLKILNARKQGDMDTTPQE